jgi:hypothetical protein
MVVTEGISNQQKWKPFIKAGKKIELRRVEPDLLINGWQIKCIFFQNYKLGTPSTNHMVALS